MFTFLLVAFVKQIAKNPQNYCLFIFDLTRSESLIRRRSHLISFIA